MEERVNYFLVGLFTLVLGAALVGGVLWLGSGKSQRKSYDVYLVDMTESVSGLSLDSAVKYRGVEVGRVRRIELVPDDGEVVGDEHEVDPRQIVEGDAGRGIAPHPDQAAEGPAPMAPVGIGQEGHSVQLHQHGGVSDPCHGRRARAIAQQVPVGRPGRQRGDAPLGHQPGAAHHERMQARPVGGPPVLGIDVLVGAALVSGRAEAGMGVRDGDLRE